jgi:hypothetical protein
MTTKRRGNPNWGKPDVHVAVTGPCTFDSLVQELKLTPEQYAGSAELKDWVRQNKDSKYVPPDLLQAWGFVTLSEL